MTLQAANDAASHPLPLPALTSTGPTGTEPNGVGSIRRSSWFTATYAGFEWLFGLASLVIGLSVLATIPVVQLVSLGYLLEVGGRVARTGRLRDGIIGVRKAARLGSIVLGTWFVFWPARAVSGLWYSSLILNGRDAATARWRIAVIVVTVLTLVHVAWAWFRGGRLRHFLWPAPATFVRRFARGGVYAEARDRCWMFAKQLRIGYYLQLGLRGALGATVWLFVPVSLLVLVPRVSQPLGAFLGLAGALGLATVVIYLPFLQVRFAASGEWREMFRVREVRRNFAAAPIAFWIALLTTLALAIPLYLLKAELIPREAAWLPSVFFVTFALPARGLSGWAIARAEAREQSRHWTFRWLSRLAMIPVAAIYVGAVYITQFVSWYGGWSLYEQHAFLLPVPFLGN